MLSILFAVLQQSPNLATDLDAILNRAGLAGANIGIDVESEDGTIVYQRGAEQRLVPASNQKLITASFTLWKLKPTYAPKTSIWRFQDHLIIETSGDPMMSLDQLKQIKKKLNPDGKCDVLLKEAYRPGFPGTWEYGDLPNHYAAPVYAFTIDRSGLELWNNHGKVELRPPVEDIKLFRSSIEGPVTDTFDPIGKTLDVKGALPDEEKIIDTLCIPDADKVAAGVIGKFLGYIDKVPATDPDYVLIGQVLPDTMKLCLQVSDNNLAENLLMMANTVSGDSVDPYPSALQEESEFLTQQVSIKKDQFHVADGSGLSRTNLITPEAIVKLLRWNLRQPTADLWRSMLDHPGIGTLKARIPGIDFQGKTGTLGMVSALSGYLRPKTGKTFLVSIITNNFSFSGPQAKDLENKLVTKLNDDLNVGTPLASN